MLVSSKNVFRELKNGNIKKVYLSKSFKDKEIISYIKNNKIKYETSSESRMNQLSKDKHQGIILEINDYGYIDVKEFYNEKIVVILDHIEDPHNFGAIIRTLEGAGVRSIIIPADRSVSVNETVIRISSGAIEYVSVSKVNNLVRVIKEFKNNGFFVYGAESDGKNYKSITYADKILLVMGSEGKGISHLVKESCDELISIPLKGKINSLNVSVATGIIIYHLIGE